MEFPRPQSGVGFFGDGPTLPVPNYAGGCGEGQDSWSSGRPMDVFAKTEKWLTPAPVPDTSKWTSRESEIMGFSEYLSMLTSWAAQASLEFAQEIEQSSRWNGVFALGCLVRSCQEQIYQVAGHTSKCLCRPRSDKHVDQRVLGGCELGLTYWYFGLECSQEPSFKRLRIAQANDG